GKPPLASSTSMSSADSQTTPAGYHTPIEDEEVDDVAPLTPRSSLLQQQAPPSPYSAVMTLSLDPYLEPQGMSFSSPPNSELNPRAPSPDDSFPVFSPPPYDAAPPYDEAVEVQRITRQPSSIGSRWMQVNCVAPQRNSVSYSSRSPLSHQESRTESVKESKQVRSRPDNYKD
ncbi:hypothetical protein WA026_022328, partial [Henosepilachna vigintioctopunctata]